MALIRNKAVAAVGVVHLRAHQLIGRWEGCHVVIPRLGVSAQHASIRWVGSRWLLRDLGSRNGTLHNGARVEPGEGKPLAPGDEIVFGEQDEVWVVDQVDPPGLLLTPCDGNGSVIHVSDAEAIYPCPSPDDPKVTVVRAADDRWYVELATGEVLELIAGEVVEFLGRAFAVSLPQHASETTEPDAPLVESSARHAEFEIEVALDEERASLSIALGQQRYRVKESVALYLLAYLARQRLADAGTSGDLRRGAVKKASRNVGWIALDTACSDLRISREQLCVHVFRVREAIKNAGLHHAGDVIERRNGWIRAGLDPARVKVRRADDHDERRATSETETRDLR